MGNYVYFVLRLLCLTLRNYLAVAALHAFVYFLCKPASFSFAFWKRELGHQISFFELDIASLSNQKSVVTRIWMISEQLSHLLSRFEVVLTSIKFKSVWIEKVSSGLHTQQGLVANRIGGVGVMKIICGHQWQGKILC